MLCRIQRAHDRLRLLLLALAMLAPLPASGKTISTIEILDQTVGALQNCLKWTLIGLCVWLDCGPSGCSIRLSVLWGNYNPDLVVSGYHRVGENPWREMAALYGGFQKGVGQRFVRALIDDVDIGEGNRPDDKFHRTHKDLRFKEADAIGHPLTPGELAGIAGELGLAPDTTLGATPMLCPRETKPFTPYLLSTLDFIAWRLTIPEMVFPEALIPGMREIGHWPVNTWQALYPRSGWTMQMEDPKSGAVVAQRAGDIVTRSAQPHVYLPTTATRVATPGIRVRYPGPLVETKRTTGMFQMLVPRESNSCEVFGQTDLVVSWANGKSDLPVPPNGATARAGNYAFNLWRPYECCQIKGDVLLTTIRWNPFPR